MTRSRAIGIAARTAHIAAVALLVGGTFALPGVHRPLWVGLVVASGTALLATELVHNPRTWVYQGCGVATLAHMGVLLAIPLAPQLSRSALLLALVIGSVGSHLPRAARKWSLLHRRVLE